MSVVPAQRVTFSESVTVVNGTSEVFALPRPADVPAGPPASNTKDHVAENPFTRKEFEAGLALLFLDTALQNAAMFVTRIAKVLDPSLAPQDPDSSVALFPNGAAQAPQPDVVFEDATGIATNAAEATALLQNLTVRSSERIEVTLRNASGGDLTGRIRAHYEMGRNPAEITLRDHS